MPIHQPTTSQSLRRTGSPYRLLYATLSLVVPLLSGCSAPWVSTTIACALPQTPPLWANVWGDPTYTVTWCSPTGQGTAPNGSPGPDSEGDSSALPGFAPGASFVLEVPNTPPVLITAEPTWDDGVPARSGEEPFACCGAVWPYHLDGEAVALDYRRGVVATALTRAVRSGARIEAFNVARLETEISTRCGDDPWSVDMERLVDAIRGQMRVTAIRSMVESPTSLVAPTGLWYGPSPFAAVLRGGEGIVVAEGTSVWYGASGARLVVTSPPDASAWMVVFRGLPDDDVHEFVRYGDNPNHFPIVGPFRDLLVGQRDLLQLFP